MRILDVLDGTTNTLMVGDKCLNTGLLGQPSQLDDNEGYTAGWDQDTIRRTNRVPTPDFSSSTGDGNLRFGSSHTAGFQAAFVDGSVHFITYSISKDAFKSLGDKADGAPLGDF